VYGYPVRHHFAVIQTLSLKKIHSYLPLLNYTDIQTHQVAGLIEPLGGESYAVRALNPDYGDFRINDPVTMRMDISSGDHHEIFQSVIGGKCRNRLRRAKKGRGFRVRQGRDRTSLDDFFGLFSRSMHHHGTPQPGKPFFLQLASVYGEDAVFYNAYDRHRIIASLCLLLDGDIAWMPWSCVDVQYRKALAGYFLVWHAIQSITREGRQKIFDFGRSPFGGGTYVFKSQWGCEPVKIDILGGRRESTLYSKYRFAAGMWKRLPGWFVNRLGPRIVPHLADM
jgi:hypothetical protein